MGVGDLRANLCHLGSANSCSSNSIAATAQQQPHSSNSTAATTAALSLKKRAAESRPWLVLGFFLNAFDHVPVIVIIIMFFFSYPILIHFSLGLRSEFRALVAHFLWPCCKLPDNLRSVSNKKFSLSQTPPTGKSESWAVDCGLLFISWLSNDVGTLT